MAVGFSNLVSYFQSYGVMDFLLPFMLVFTIIFAILQKSQVLGDDKKNFNVIVALVLSLLFVAPHMTGSYPLGYDPVQVINEALPSVSLVAIAAIMLLMMVGIFGGEFKEKAMPFIAFISLAFIVYIFGSTNALNFWGGPHDIFSWWTSELTELLLIILVFGLIVHFITKEDKGTKELEEASKARWDFWKNFVGPRTSSGKTKGPGGAGG